MSIIVSPDEEQFAGNNSRGIEHMNINNSTGTQSHDAPDNHNNDGNYEATVSLNSELMDKEIAAV